MSCVARKISYAFQRIAKEAHRPYYAIYIQLNIGNSSHTPERQAVFKVAAGDALFALRRLWAGGFLGVQAIGLDLFIGCHYGSNGSGRGEQGGIIESC